jgi:hypothetical protein
MWFIALAAVSLLGVWLAAWAIYGDPARGRRRCPTCWYDMSGTPASRRCPECGHACEEEKDLLRPRRRRFLATIGIFLAFTPGAWALVATGIERGWHYYFLSTWKAISALQSGPFTIEVREIRNPNAPDWTRQARITRDGRSIFALDSFYPSIGQRLPDRVIGRGEDLTGNGLPDFIIRDDTGGSGCFGASWLIELDASQPRSGLTLIGMFDYCGRFEDVDGDGVVEFIAGDRTFAYRWTSGADSPQPQVILRLREGLWVAALDLMRQPPLSEGEIDARLAGFRNARPDWDGRFAALLAVSLDLIYTGNADQAWRLLEQGWPVGEGKFTHGGFAAQLRGALAESPFAAEIEALNCPPD